MTTTFTPGPIVTIPIDNVTTDTTTVNITTTIGAHRVAPVTKVVTGAQAAQRGDVVIEVSCSAGRR